MRARDSQEAKVTAKVAGQDTPLYLNNVHHSSAEAMKNRKKLGISQRFQQLANWIKNATTTTEPRARA